MIEQARFSPLTLSKTQKWPSKSSQTMLLMMAALVVYCSKPAYSQDAVAISDAPATTLEQLPGDPANELESRLKSLMDATERLRRMRNLDTTEKTNPNSNSTAGARALAQGSESGGMAGAPNEVLDVLTGLQPDPASELKEIRERIRVLQKLRRDPQRSIPSAAANTDTPLHPLPAMETVTPAPTQPPKVHPAVDQSLAAADQVSANNQTDSGDPEFGNPDVTGTQLLPVPVNTLALGESLYRTGNYKAALQALQKVDTQSMPQSDRMWLDLLLALCQQKQKQFESSIGTLRDIANETSPDYPVQAAKWYLKYAETEQKNVEALDQLSKEIELIVERVENHVGNK
ncbi:tetratricopeptide repeat protein [Roseiconus lacunae]|uniref:tetratricopeptide repeat protein n=2 Tax=Roseiconus lacunae TaxID=2605694 RepID=UPI00135BF9F5|nr:CDC27 family protein [Roseiconus lacunae]MCD0459908.1 CDC27 family protein [Roseiconus lacunae]